MTLPLDNPAPRFQPPAEEARMYRDVCSHCSRCDAAILEREQFYTDAHGNDVCARCYGDSCKRVGTCAGCGEAIFENEVRFARDSAKREDLCQDCVG